jgi:hypothetical protein
MFVSCYQQPAIPRDKPLTCTGNEDDPDDCPAGFRCVGERAGERVCANLTCTRDQECPVGLVCNERTGCDLPESIGGADGGAGDARDGGDGPVVSDTPSALDAPGGS